MTPIQAGVLLYLHGQREPNARDTAAAVGVAWSTLSVTVRTLVRKRWVTRQRSREDRRVVRLGLTQRGALLAGRIQERIREVKNELTLMKEA